MRSHSSGFSDASRMLVEVGYRDVWQANTGGGSDVGGTVMQRVISLPQAPSGLIMALWGRSLPMERVWHYRQIFSTGRANSQNFRRVWKGSFAASYGRFSAAGSLLRVRGHSSFLPWGKPQ